MNANSNANANTNANGQRQPQLKKGRKRTRAAALASSSSSTAAFASSSTAAAAAPVGPVATKSKRNKSKSRSRSNIKNENQNESEILATIGTSVTSSSTYENRVLRDATEGAAPTLTGIGFPDLRLLAPSFQNNGSSSSSNSNSNSNKYSNSNSNKSDNIGVNDGVDGKSKLNSRDVSHMITVFQRVQSELDEIESKATSKKNVQSAVKQMEHKRANILRMKKQMLLSFFQSYTDPDPNAVNSVQSEDLGYDPRYDRKMEQNRSHLLHNYSRVSSSSNGRGHDGEEMISHASLMRRNMKKGGGDANVFQVSTLDTKRLEDIKQNNLSEYNDDDHDDGDNGDHGDHGDDTKISELEKKEEEEVDILLSNSKNASFGQHALSSQYEARQQLLRKKKAKNKMMMLKRQLVEENGEEWIDPEELYKKRLERRERRRERKYGGREKSAVGAGDGAKLGVAGDDQDRTSADAATYITASRKNQKKKGKIKTRSTAKTVSIKGLLQKNTDCTKKTPCEKKISAQQLNNATNDDDVNDTTTTKNANEKNDPLPASSLVTTISTNEATTITPATTIPATTKDETIQTVSCPICNNNRIRVPNEYSDDIDLFLSSHMTSCNGVMINDEINNTCNNKNRVGTRRSRRRCATQNVINYTDYDEEKNDVVVYDDDDDDDDDGNDKNKNANISSNNDGQVKENGDDKVPQKDVESLENQIEESDKGDNYVNDSDIGDEEESDFEDKNGINSNENCDDQHSESLKASSEEIEYVRRKTVDDFDEEDYEDRVDEWIEIGIQNMREMKEQDSNEDKPGAVTFPGGLEIPAWINDRLFTYQRTALRWMWELHRQNAGGIVGDEMGLGKTVQVNDPRPNLLVDVTN